MGREKGMPGSEIKFLCKHCGQALEADSDMAGETLNCPACKKVIEVPLVSEARKSDLTWHILVLWIFFCVLVFGYIGHCNLRRSSSSPVPRTTKQTARDNIRNQIRDMGGRAGSIGEIGGGYVVRVTFKDGRRIQTYWDENGRRIR